MDRLATSGTSLVAVHIVIYASVYLWFGSAAFWPVTVALMLICVWISVNDIMTFEIPDFASLSLLVIGLAASPVEVIELRIFGAVLWFLIFWIICALARKSLQKEGLGFGDVKLMAGIGAWFGPVMTISIVLGASLSAIAAYLVLSKFAGSNEDNSRNAGIAFGPFLCFFAWATWVQWSG